MTRKRRAAKHVTLYAASTFIRRAVGLVMLPIYTRYLTPADYGIVTLLSMMLIAFETAIGARFIQAIPKFYYDQESERDQLAVVSTAIILTGAISFVGAAVIVLSSGSLSNFLLGTTEYQDFVGIYGLLFITMAIEYYGYQFVRILERPVLYLVTSISRLTFQLALNVWFVVILEKGVWGVIAGSVISSVVFSSIFAVFVGLKTGLQFRKDIAVQLLKFSWPLWISGVATLYIASSGRYFIRVFANLDEVGLFELANRFSSLILVLVWVPFTQWWQTERFKIFKLGPNGHRQFRMVFDVISTALLTVAVGVAILSEPVIRIMAAPDFHGAIPAVPALAFATVYSELSVFFYLSFFASESTKTIARLNWATAAIVSLAYILLIPSFGFVGATVAFLVSSVFVFHLAFFLSNRIATLGIRLTHFYQNSAAAGIVTTLNILIPVETPLVIKLTYQLGLITVYLAFSYAQLRRNSTTRGLVLSAQEALHGMVYRRKRR